MRRLPLCTLLALAACAEPQLLEGPVGRLIEVEPEGEGWSLNDEVYKTSDGLIELYFTTPGTVRDMGEDPFLDDAAIALIDSAETRIDASL